jgi:hypothetical protein
MNKIRFEFEETGLDKSFIEIIKNQVLGKIKNVKCPNGHKKDPIITITGKNANGLDLSVKSCCDKYGELISSKINR